MANILDHSHNEFDDFLELLQVTLTPLLLQSGNRTEFELIRELSAPPYSLFQPDCLRDSLSMYRVHFILFHVLYQLRDQFFQEQLGNLHISALSIRLLPYSPGEEGLVTTDPLRDFYLNRKNFQYSREDIDKLLNDFWRGASNDISLLARQEALRTLELEEPVDYPTLKKQYRRLAMIHHPDRGGDADKLKQINAAMAILSGRQRNR